MNLYLVSRVDKIDCDKYDSFICVAENERAAMWLHPNGDAIEWGRRLDERRYHDLRYSRFSNDTWVEFLDMVVVEHLGETNIKEKEVLLASFNSC
jgi:hypothetical protein